MWLIVALGACSRSTPDPALAQAAQALAAWREGEASLSAGRAEEARAAFQRASALRPDPVLSAWEAQAALAAGDHDGALSCLRTALAGEPGLAAARWALALELAARGEHDNAASELQRALGDGAGRPVDVRLDPAWAPFLGDPAYSFVPAHAVDLVTDPVPETTFWGSELTVTLHARGELGSEVSFGAVASGPVELRSVAEEVGIDERKVGIVWRVTGAGPITLGPFTVTTGGVTRESPARATVAAAPPGKETPPPSPAWTVVSGDLLPPAIGRRGDVVWVPVEGADRVVSEPSAPQLRVQQRRGDTVRAWVGLLGLPPGTPLRVGRGTQIREEVAP
jgi:hypothetical protein